MGAMSSQTRLDRSSGIPLYQQLADLIRADVERGGYRPGEILPSEGELCAAYGLSRSVTRQALRMLSQTGVIRTERGRGSFVAEKKLSERFVQRTSGFYDDLVRMGLRVETKVLHQQIEPVSSEIRDFLGIDRAVRIDRLRSVEGRVLEYVRIYLPPTRVPGLESVNLTNRSLYRHLREAYGLEISHGLRTVEAVAADDEIAAHLGISRGTPTLLLTSASRTPDGAPLEWFSAWHRADRTRFEIEVVQGKDRQRFEPAVVGGLAINGRPQAGPAQEVTGLAPHNLGGMPHPERQAALHRRLVSERIIAVLRPDLPADWAAVVSALAAGGIRVVEFATSAGDPAHLIGQARAASSDLLIGAGDLRSVQEARRWAGAGAEYLSFSIGPLENGRGDLGAAVIGSGFTPHEVSAAHAWSGGPVTWFPASSPSMLNQLDASLPGIGLIATGGLDGSNLVEYLAAGAIAAKVEVPAALLSDSKPSLPGLTEWSARLRHAVEDRRPTG